MNKRQRKKRIKDSLFHDYETKGKKIYSYAVACGNVITIGFTARPKQKGCDSYSEKYILEELNLYGHKATYELISPF